VSGERIEKMQKKKINDGAKEEGEICVTVTQTSSAVL
jgi:hypothetical protein